MFQEWFAQGASTISEVVVGLSAIAVALIGFFGLQQWRRELKGKSRFDLARRIALGGFEFRDRFGEARNPFTFAGESSDRSRAPNEDPEVANILDEWHARGKRMEALRASARSLHEASWEASILLDDQVPRLIEPLETSLRDLSVSFQTYFQSQLMDAKSGRTPAQGREWLEQHHRNVYGMPDDDMGRSVVDGVHALVEWVKKYVR